MAEIWRVNSAGVFNLVLQGGVLMLYSGEETDLMIRPAMGQNEVFLLKAFAGNLYQFPTTGVGLVEFCTAISRTPAWPPNCRASSRPTG